MSSFDKKKVYWLRWIFFIPFAIMMSELICWIYAVINKLFSKHGSYYMEHIVPTVALILSAMAFMASAKYVIPSNKKRASRFILFLFILPTLLFVVNFYITKNSFESESYQTTKDWMILYATLIVTNIFYKGENFLGFSSDLD
jgi:hypothetical protein